MPAGVEEEMVAFELDLNKNIELMLIRLFYDASYPSFYRVIIRHSSFIVVN